MVKKFIPYLTVDHNVVKKYEEKLSCNILEHMVHKSLESARGICEAKGHH